MPTRFQCLMCGRCCRLSPITLLPHEVLTLSNVAKKLGIDVEFKPSFVVYDELSGKNIVISYAMQLVNGKCPFLTETNRCLLHSKYKPYVCRAFPYIPMYIKYYFDESNKLVFYRVRYGVSTACRFVIMFKHILTDKSIQEVFPNEIVVAKEMEGVRSAYMHALTLLWRSGLIKLNSKAVAKDDYVNAYELIRSKLFYIYMPIKRI
ncbi:MAG TPA: YkgJ family cysteine cluster protein [Acidilobales archaeon]|nr:YkgJ family cysteine cluster protein [Acidilobales archaeon]